MSKMISFGESTITTPYVRAGSAKGHSLVSASIHAGDAAYQFTEIVFSGRFNPDNDKNDCKLVALRLSPLECDELIESLIGSNAQTADNLTNNVTDVKLQKKREIMDLERKLKALKSEAQED